LNSIITDLLHIKDINLDKFNKIYLIGYAKDNIDKLLEIKKSNSNVEVVLPSSNFDKAYYNINSYIGKLANVNIELLSLFKLCKQDLFNLGMIMIGLKNSNSLVKIQTQYNDYLYELEIISKEQLLKSNTIKVNYSKQFIYLVAINLKAILFFIKSFFSKLLQIEKVLMDYPAKRVLGSLEEDSNAILIDLNGSGKIINFKGLRLFFTQQKKLLKLSFKYKILNQTIYQQANHTLRAISLANYYNPKLILGALDAYTQSDIYSFIFKVYNIKFGCYSHGYSYDFRLDYIYIPFDFYFLWSKGQKRHIEKGQYIQSDCRFYITGCPFYKNTSFNIFQNETKNKIYDILVICEYYYHNYSLQPFNSIPTKKLANVLNKYKGKYNICIRPRNKDEYYKDMYDILGSDVIYSFPKNETTATATILEDIQASKVVVSMISSGMHDSLLLNTPVIQANFTGIKEPKEFDINKVVYYTDTPEELENMIDDFFDSKLEILDYDKNNKYYFNSGKFDIDKVREVINDYI
jgi:hypothetical protein